MPITNLAEKFAYELGCLYDAEQRLLEAQQEAQARASDAQLQALFQTHADETRQQITNLDQVYERLGQTPERITSAVVGGLMTDTRKALQEIGDNAQLRDCVLAAGQMQVEHLEIAWYRGLIIGAELLGQDDVVRLLRENLQQEERTANLIEVASPALLEQVLEAREA